MQSQREAGSEKVRYGVLYKVPAADTDIVFSSISEEWGLLTALLAVFMILLIIVSALINTPRSYFHTTLSVGVAAVFIAQMSLNIFGSCNIIPFTGVTIPFISQGGSSMLSCGLMAGFLKAGQAMVYPVPQNRRCKAQAGGLQYEKFKKRKPAYYSYDFCIYHRNDSSDCQNTNGSFILYK